MPKKFKQAVQNCPAISEGYREGLGALTKHYRDKTAVARQTRITGSIDLDRTLARHCPNEPRWDFGIGHCPASGIADDEVCWLEVHEATAGAIDKMIGKLEFLTNWLKKNASDLDALRCLYVWVASGNVSIPPHQRRKFESKGMILVGQRYTIGIRKQ